PRPHRYRHRPGRELGAPPPPNPPAGRCLNIRAVTEGGTNDPHPGTGNRAHGRQRRETGSRAAGIAADPARLVLGLTSAAYFMAVLDSVAVITALPRMQRDLHVGLPALQWTVNSYGIAFAAGIITAAALGDRLGRRRVFISGLALFTLASAACALAPSAAALV